MDAQPDPSVAPPGCGPVHVHFVLLPGSLILDWAGPAEALRMANQRLRDAGQPDGFALHFMGPGRTSASSVGRLRFSSASTMWNRYRRLRSNTRCR